MKSILLIFIIILLVSLGLNFYFYQGRQNPSAESQAEAEKVVVEVRKLILLPEDEVPTVATVSDPQKLKDQPFFSRAESGDKVLIYTKSAKAILWRPSTGQIIEVSPINIGQNLEQ